MSGLDKWFAQKWADIGSKDKDGKFKKMNSIESGINFVGQVREFLSIDNYLFVLNNDEKIQTYQLKNQ